MNNLWQRADVFTRKGVKTDVIKHQTTGKVRDYNVNMVERLTSKGITISPAIDGKQTN